MPAVVAVIRSCIVCTYVYLYVFVNRGGCGLSRVQRGGGSGVRARLCGDGARRAVALHARLCRVDRRAAGRRLRQDARRRRLLERLGLRRLHPRPILRQTGARTATSRPLRIYSFIKLAFHGADTDILATILAKIISQSYSKYKSGPVFFYSQCICNDYTSLS